MNNAHWQKSRNIVERIIVTGELILETPTSLSNGDADGITDISLLLDPLEGIPLLTGASIAGALRSYLRERELGYGQAEASNTRHALLFGGIRQNSDGRNSPLIVNDAFDKNKVAVELRDGVRIDPKTRTAEDKKKFDMELLATGTTFSLSFELLLNEKDKEQLKQGLVLALQGFEKGEIPIGGRKRRGLGQCRVQQWTVQRYDMTKSQDLFDWLEGKGKAETGQIADLIDLDLTDFEDKRKQFTLKATFAVDGSLLIRSGSGKADAPDMVHLHSKRNGKDVPIVSGTSLTGALRARANRIANTIKKPSQFVESMFGSTMDDRPENPTASRVIVQECEIHNGITELVQNRVKIDRFTGGSYPTALFNQQPLFGRFDDKTCLTINVELRQADEIKFEAEIGLLLLLLKDLWTGDLPLGGESSVGRGRLKGLRAEMKLQGQEWILHQTEDDRLTGDKDALEKFVTALQREANHV